MVDTPKAFRLILDNAARGQKIIYYEGDLQFDRQDRIKMADEDRVMLGRLADCVYDASELDRVHLFQKRLEPFKWQYYALVRKS